MKQVETDLPPSLIAAVRSGFDAFVQLQRVRFGKCTGTRIGSTADGVAPLPVNSLALTASSDIATAAASKSPFPESLSEWSDLLLSRLRVIREKSVVDPTAEVLWELVSVVIAILENGGDDGVIASAAYLEWYRNRFVNLDVIYKMQGVLREGHVPLHCTLAGGDEEAEGSEKFLEDILAPYMVTIQRSFFAGLFPVAAQLIDSLIKYLRSQSVNAFDAEEESALADVLRLLSTPPSNSAEQRDWVAAANGLITDCKRILLHSNGGDSITLQVSQQLKSLCLDLLLMMSGDAALILQTCYLLELDVIDYLAAVCAVCDPYLTLRQVHSIYQSASESWCGPTKGPWYIGVVGSLLGSRCMADVVKAMRFVGQAVRRNQCTSQVSHLKGDSNVVSSPNSSEDDNNNQNYSISDTGIEGKLRDDQVLFRHFALLFMAAHVADICAPPLGAAIDQMDVTFARNEVMESYISLFSYHPLLWRTAITYVVFSPLMNPAIMYEIVTALAKTAASDRYTFLALHTFIQSSWEENSNFQVTLRRLLHDKYPFSETLKKWFTSVDYYKCRATEVLHDKIIRERLECGDTAPALWLAVETQQSKSLQIRLEQILRTPDVFKSEEVQRVGQAVNNSFISVDTSASLRMLQVLRVCAALSEYQRALRCLQEHDKQDGMMADENTIRSVLSAAEKTIRCAVSFRMHPVTVLTLVEETADIAWRFPQGQKPNTLFALLSHALEFILISHPASHSEYTVQAGCIREKIMKLL